MAFLQSVTDRLFVTSDRKEKFWLVHSINPGGWFPDQRLGLRGGKAWYAGDLHDLQQQPSSPPDPRINMVSVLELRDEDIHSRSARLCHHCYYLRKKPRSVKWNQPAQTSAVSLQMFEVWENICGIWNKKPLTSILSVPITRWVRLCSAAPETFWRYPCHSSKDDWRVWCLLAMCGS